jgi:hypothetical protein
MTTSRLTSRSTRIFSLLAFFALLFSFLTPIGSASSEILVNGADPDCVSSGQADRFASAYCTIRAAVTDAQAGDVIRVADGVYNENITINKNLTLLSINGRDAAIITGADALGGLGTLHITSGTTGVQIGAPGQGFTILGFDSSSAGIEKAAVYFQGAHSGAVIMDNRIVANGDAGLMTEYGAVISNFVISGNEFAGQTFVGDNPAGDGFGQQFTLPNVPRQLVVMGGGPSGTNTNNISFTGNLITGTAGGLNTDGNEQGNSLVTIDAGSSLFTDNIFAGTTTRGAASLRIRRPGASITGNTFQSAGLSPSAVHLYLQNNPLTLALCEDNTFENGVCYENLLGGVIGTSIQTAVSAAPAGSTITLSPGVYTGGVLVDKSLFLDGGGALIGPGSPAFTITANDVTITNFIVDGSGAGTGEPGILVADGVQRLYLYDLEIRSWPGAGVEFLGTATDLKLIDNYIHDNLGDGIYFSGELFGIVQIYGNAFRSNGAAGIRSVGTVQAGYNEWGSYDGPMGDGGDGASDQVDYTPYVFGKVYVQAPASVREGEPVTVDVLVDAQSLFGAQFQLSYNPALLAVTSVQVSGTGYFQDGQSCTTNTTTAGFVSFYCSLGAGNTPVSAQAVKLASITFQAQPIATASAAALLDLVDTSVRLGAPDGINIFIDSITDGSLTILGTTTVAGRVDLQGRANESGAVVDPAAGEAYGMDPSPVTTGIWGTFSFTSLTDDTYVFTIEMPRYLDASAEVVVAGGTLTLTPVLLLGGDVDDDDVIGVNDASAIGGAFWTTPSDGLWNANADINDDSRVDILDLVLMGGNYGLTSSPWTP